MCLKKRRVTKWDVLVLATLRYVLQPLDKRVQNEIVDLSTSRKFMLNCRFTIFVRGLVVRLIPGQ